MKSQANKADQFFQKGFVSHQARRLDEAEKSYRQALRHSPADMETLYLLGTVLGELGKGEEAIKYLKKSLKIKPDHPEALNNLGVILNGAHKYKEAVTHYQCALSIRPDYVDALINIGIALDSLEQLDEAESFIRRAIRLNPSFANAHYSLGLVLKKKDLLEEASQCFLRGLELKPDFAAAYDDLGSIYKVWGRTDDALKYFNRGLSLTPNSYSLHNNLGATLEEIGHFEEALDAYERAATINPERTTARWNQAFLFLRQGILDRGWEMHELRLSLGGQVLDRFPYPTWDGLTLTDKTLLIFAEQGLGDQILFASCFQDVIAQAGHCVIECDFRLAPLFARSFPDATIQGATRMEINWLLDAPKIDVQIAAGSLPRFLRPTLESFPRNPSYLVADPQRVEYWHKRLALIGPGLKVGICWRSSLTTGERHKLYTKLTQWGDILKISGVHFVNLQYDECSAELSEAENKFGITIISFPDIDLRNEIDESAALTTCMDVVISAGTAVSEMAGALGVESYRFDPYERPWTNLGLIDRMPWHPSIKIFPAPSLADFNTPLLLIAKALQDKVIGSTNAVEFTQLPDGIEIALSSSLDDLSSYILKEQDGWFDPEYEFVLGNIRSGMRIVDAGSDFGAYAIPLAKKIMYGKLWAIRQTASEINLLMQSRMRNHLEKNLNISAFEKNLSLDSEMNRYGLNNIDLVRISIEISNSSLFENGTQFFSLNSPLVMFGIRRGEEAGIELANQLMSYDYGLYRLVPGLDLLAPLASTDELDAFSLNLFACKPDRAEWLEGQGVLIRQSQTLDSMPGIDRSDWQEYLKVMPYAKDHVNEWVNSPQKCQDWEVYWMALNLFAISKSENVPVSQRYAHLQAAADIMSTLIQEQVNIPRLLTWCRILTEMGKREAAVTLLNRICSLLDSGIDLPLNEPFLALTDAHDQSEPGDRLPEWLVAMILQQREWLRSFSSFFTGEESLPVLEEIRASGFGSEMVNQRIMLIKKRFAII
jgi:tetratricopeptide (TPR) repeat protein